MTPFKGKPFTDTFGELAHGQFLSEVTEAVYNIVAAVMETRKPGELKIKLKFTPTGKGTVNVDADFDAKEPEHDRETTTFFVGKDFSLQRQDPNQPRLPLREVDMPDNEPVKVSG
jgi:hypothetical protein